MVAFGRPVCGVWAESLGNYGMATFHPINERPYPSLVSVVIPCYNEEEVVPILREQFILAVDRLKCEWELILVNDGSSDRTIELLMEWAANDYRVKVLHLARNFGHQSASTAGLDYARGDAVILMDADLQDPPELIHPMIAAYQTGYDVVYGKRTKRQGESIFKLASAWLFYRMMRTLVHKDLPVDVGDFRLISRSCLNALNSLRETHRFLRGMVSWVGYPQTAVEYVRAIRAGGETKYPLHKMLRFAWMAALSFSALPLRLSLVFGALLLLLGVALGVYGVISFLTGRYVVPGWTSILVIQSLIGGASLLGVGIVGEYVGRIYEAVKGRPLYIVSRAVNMVNQEPPGGQNGISPPSLIEPTIP